MREKFNQEELDVAMLKNMTGIKVTWLYPENVALTEQPYLNDNMNFRKLANEFHKNGSHVQFRSELKTFKVNLMQKFMKSETEVTASQ